MPEFFQAIEALITRRFADLPDIITLVVKKAEERWGEARQASACERHFEHRHCQKLLNRRPGRGDQGEPYFD